MAQEKGKERFSARLQTFARDPKVLLQLGKSAFLVEHYAEAVEAYQKCIALDPRNDAAHYNLGVAWQAMGRHCEARRAFVKTLELNPKHKAAQEALNSLAAY